MDGVLNKTFVGFLNRFENFSIMPNEESIFVKKIKGSTLGKTLNDQAEMPSKACPM